MLWRTMALLDLYGTMTLNLEQIAKQTGLTPEAIQERRESGEFKWIRLNEEEALVGDVVDLANYLDQRRAGTVS